MLRAQTANHRQTDWLTSQPPPVAIFDILEAGMSTLATILTLWFMVAPCAILFVRGASPRVATRLERRKVTVEAYPYRRR